MSWTREQLLLNFAAITLYFSLYSPFCKVGSHESLEEEIYLIRWKLETRVRTVSCPSDKLLANPNQVYELR